MQTRKDTLEYKYGKRSLLQGCILHILLLWDVLDVTGHPVRHLAAGSQDPGRELREQRDKLQWILDRQGQERQTIAGRGIVMPAGSRTQLVNAYVAIKSIREHLNSTLPIEVYFDGSGETDLQVFSKLQDIPGVYLRDASQLTRPEYLSPWPEQLHGYAKKIFSLYSTGFQQVLLLDSDSQPLVTPELLFDLPEFRRLGNVFWPDYWDGSTIRYETPKPEAYSMLNLPDPREGDPGWACVDSGQLLLDKGRHADVVDWVMWLNKNADVVYKYMLGDKDTFEMGFMLSNKHDQFYRMPIPPRAALTKEVQDKAIYIHAGMVHSIRGGPAFIHRAAGGKFDDAKPKEDQLLPALLTEPINATTARHIVWDPSLANAKIVSENIVLAACANASYATNHAVKRFGVSHVRDIFVRHKQCPRHHNKGKSAQAIQASVFADNIVRSIDFSLAAFQELKEHLEEADRKQTPRALRI